MGTTRRVVEGYSVLDSPDRKVPWFTVVTAAGSEEVRLTALIVGYMPVFVATHSA